MSTGRLFKCHKRSSPRSSSRKFTRRTIRRFRVACRVSQCGEVLSLSLSHSPLASFPFFPSFLRWHAKTSLANRRSLVDVCNHIAFNSISCARNIPALEIAPKCFSAPLSSHPCTATPACHRPYLLFSPSLSLYIYVCMYILYICIHLSTSASSPRVFPLSLLLCFATILARVAQSRLPNIHRLLILLTVCATSSKLRTTRQGKRAHHTHTNTRAHTHTHAKIREAACSDMELRIPLRDNVAETNRES